MISFILSFGFEFFNLLNVLDFRIWLYVSSINFATSWCLLDIILVEDEASLTSGGKICKSTN